MTDDVPRWVWTPGGMDPYRSHPLMQDVGGVFVTAEKYKQLEARVKVLAKALEEAGQAIHSEYCGSEHHIECRKVTYALMQSQEPA